MSEVQFRCLFKYFQYVKWISFDYKVRRKVYFVLQVLGFAHEEKLNEKNQSILAVRAIQK